MTHAKIGSKKTCSRGHVFIKSSVSPVCPSCWPGYYKKKHHHGELPKLPVSAMRALISKKITTTAKLAEYRESDIFAFRGIGAVSLAVLRRALRANGLSFRAERA